MYLMSLMAARIMQDALHNGKLQASGRLPLAAARIAPKVLLPGSGWEEVLWDTLCQKSCYRGGNGQNDESEDTDRGFDEAAAAL